MPLHRVFIAFPVSDEAKEELERIQAELEPLNRKGRIRWSKPEGMHVTLEFLGEIDEEKIEKIKLILKKIKYSSFSYWLSHIDAFPNKEQANVIVVKVAEEACLPVGRGSAGTEIQAEMAQELRKLGLEIEDRHWIPHLTLGRNKSNDKIFGLDKIPIKKIKWKVDKVELIESELLSEGPRYTILESFSLKNNL